MDMRLPFAALQDRVNRVAYPRLANAVAEVGGKDVPVFFDDPYAGPFGGQVDATQPECSGPSEALAGLQRGSAIKVDGRVFTVGRSEPDGPGWTRLVLQGG